MSGVWSSRTATRSNRPRSPGTNGSTGSDPGGHTHRVDITVELVRRLVVRQFPEWSDLPILPGDRQGNDNRTFRLGNDLAMRLPSHERYVAGIAKEDKCLLLAQHLSLAVPTPVASGRPSQEYPHPWSVRRWIAGDTPDRDPHLDCARFAHDLGVFLRELRTVPPHDGPLAGRHSFYRGCPRASTAIRSRPPLAASWITLTVVHAKRSGSTPRDPHGTPPRFGCTVTSQSRTC